MKKNKNSFLIIVILLFGAKGGPAQRFEVNPRFLIGLGGSIQHVSKYGDHGEYGYYFLCFIKEKKAFGQLDLGSVYFNQGKGGSRFVHASNFVLKGGVRLPGFEKVSLYLNGGAGVVVSGSKDYTGTSYQGGIKVLQALPILGVFESNLNFIHYTFDQGTQEGVSFGIIYWLPVPRKRKWPE